MTWFARVFAHHPFIVLTAMTVFSLTCLLISFTTIRPPNFKEPQLGFETRGTEISQRLTAWENLREAVQQSGSLTVSPPKENPMPVNVSNTKGTESGKIFGFVSSSNDSLILDSESSKNKDSASSDNEDERWETLISRLDSDPGSEHHNHDHKSDREFFCDDPATDYGRIVISGRNSQINLFTLPSLLDVCKLQSLITSPDIYKSISATTSKEQRLCRPWSLPNYVTLLANKTSCFNITEEDIKRTKNMLEYCRHYYKDLSCINWKPEDVHNACEKCRHMFDMIQYILDYEYLNETQSLKNALILLPIARSTAALPYFHVLERMDLKMGSIEVTGIDFGLKNALFDELLLADTKLIAAGGAIVILCMWIYTGSLFITLMTMVAIAFSLAVAYFMYVLILEINFFPFMNLLAVVVAVGIGGDTSLMMYKIWTSSKKGNEALKSVTGLVQCLHSHSTISLFVTSFTTAVAFYSSYISNITAICCFSVFAGTAVLSNLVVMMGWFPATLVINESLPKCQLKLRKPAKPKNTRHNKRHSAPPVTSPPVIKKRDRISRFLIAAIIDYPKLWVMLLTPPILMTPYILFVRPGLRLPDTPDLQLFASDHLFEQYDNIYKHRFWFDRIEKLDGWPDPMLELPLRFVWGVLPVDNGDYNDPASRGTLQFDRSFDIASRDSQVWLISFCTKLRAQPFFKPTSGPLLSNCFLENFIDWMKRKCDDPIDKLSRAPCCESARFPFPRKVFSTCLALAANSLYNTPAQLIASEVAGPKFARKTRSGIPKVKALVVEYNSNYSYSTSFFKMDTFYKQVETWSRREMASAPAGMRNGWFISHLSLYDVQQSLAKDTITAILISTIASLIVVCLATRDLLLSFAASITVASIILVTIALLVLFGWKLNIIEAVAVSLAIGLAVDFSIHYVVNYRVAPDNCTRVEAVIYSLSMMSGPTAMAAITTAATGVLMSPSSVLAYRQIGIFLILLMVVSWVYATFFLMSLLTLFGPNVTRYRVTDRNKNNGSDDIDGRTKPGSSTSGNTPVTIEQHELIGVNPQTEGRRAADHSPSAASATTILHDDECENPAPP
ncbi:hypothetical protein O3M35_003165 [Rhynocoris fuscipes]|uniref:SSD domain-containing protein n=1 Tax=Rhynocoris fuscipes TaxID=488301 RepID=A0AAW1CI22_9HEMI